MNENNMNVNLKVKIAHNLALWLLRRGVTQRRWMWNAVYAFMPSLAALAAGLSEVYRPGNSIIWYYSPDDEDDDLDGLLNMISERIDRAPAPFGCDNFVVGLELLSAIPNDPAEMTFERADATLESRHVVRAWELQGNRWKNWKNGSSKQELLTILQQAVPTPESPVTLIRAAVLGASFARLCAPFRAG